MTIRLETFITELRQAFARPIIDPLDPSAPKGTQYRRIAAYNALLDLAKPGRDRYCAYVATTGDSPCILKEGHAPSRYDEGATHMNVEQRDRAERYLAHSEPDPARRA